MAEQSLKPIIEKLESLFSKFNERFYTGELQRPIITVSPDTKKGAYGWCTSWKAWTDKEQEIIKDIADLTAEELEAMKEEGFYEINICAEHLSRPFEQIAETMLHEMVHLYNLQNGIQDTSRAGTYHNKKYKAAAEAHGLNVEQGSKYGWCITSLNEEAAAYIKEIQDKSFQLYRRPVLKIGKGTKQSTRKYICPCCGLIIRATKEVDVICAECNEHFVEAE